VPEDDTTADPPAAPTGGPDPPAAPIGGPDHVFTNQRGPRRRLPKYCRQNCRECAGGSLLYIHTESQGKKTKGLI